MGEEERDLLALGHRHDKVTPADPAEQQGFVSPSGLKTIIHSWFQQCADDHRYFHTLVHLQNAVNKVDWYFEMRRGTPAQAEWCDTCHAEPSIVLFGTVNVPMLCGVQRDDRRDRLFFALAVHGSMAAGFARTTRFQCLVDVAVDEGAIRGT